MLYEIPANNSSSPDQAAPELLFSAAPTRQGTAVRDFRGIAGHEA
jgi:hypothetical protein